MLLKFGQIKEWNEKEFDESNHELLDKLMSARHMFAGFQRMLMTMKHTPKCNKATIEIIKLTKPTVNFWNDFDNKQYTKEEAIDYIKNYKEESELSFDKSWENIEAELKEFVKGDVIEEQIAYWKGIYDWFEENYQNK